MNERLVSGHAESDVDDRIWVWHAADRPGAKV
jgi:hypothetical protein